MEGSSFSQRPRIALHSGSKSTSSSYSASGAAPQQQTNGSADPGRAQSHGQRGHNARGSEEIISNLIFSLTPISNQSDQLLDQLLPEQESQTQRPGSKSKKRAQPSYSTTSRSTTPRSAPTGDAPSFFSPHIKETVVVADKYRERGELPTVDEGSPSSSKSPRTASRNTKRNSLPPPMPVPRRSNSLHATAQSPGRNQSNVLPGTAVEMTGPTEMFGSVSVMPGRTNSPSITSADSVGRRPIIALNPSRGKSTKSRIKELDAERKRRLSSKNVPRSSVSGKAGKGPHSPSLSKSYSGSNSLPRTSGVGSGLSGEERSSSPSRPSFLRHLSASNSNSRSPSALGQVEGADLSEPMPSPPSEIAQGKRAARAPSSASRSIALGGGGGGAGANGGFAVPSRTSSKQTGLESVQAARATLAAQDAERRGEILRVAAERDEAGTTQRIQELKAQKQLRDRRQSEAASRPALADIASSSSITNGHPKSIHSEGRHVDPLPPDEFTLSSTPFEQENYSRKNTMTRQEPPLMPPPKLLGAALAEPRASFSSKRPFSNIGNYGRPSVDIDTFSVADSIDEDVDEYLLDQRLSQKIYHQDTGRCVSYSEVGDPNGFVIMCCVGMGTSRYVTAFYDELAQTLGLRLITPERPGIGDSEPYVQGEVDTPLGWPDDIRLICQHLNISRFALLAHSAGAIYALATALRMPGNIRGRVHILAPWIPPSQLMAIGQNEQPVPVAELPLIQRILKSIPEGWLEAATRVFNMSSITSSLGKSPYAKRRRNTMPNGEKRPNRGETPAPPRDNEEAIHSAPTSPNPGDDGDVGLKSRRQSQPTSNLRRSASAAQVNPDDPRPTIELDLDTLTAEEREAEYDRRLTAMIWQLATSNANPAVDLLVCLERKQEIGFRYEDITKPIVLHHGTKDTRVNVDNVVWLGENMRRCEVRILEDEGHGLMANARVMYSVLSEMAQDWRDWNAVVRGKKQ